jgi:hypothetical protein
MEPRFDFVHMVKSEEFRLVANHPAASPGSHLELIVRLFYY